MKAKVGRELKKKKTKRNENKIQRKCEKRKRRQADKQMKFINMLLITPDNGHDRVKGSRGRRCCFAVCAFCIQIAKLMSKTQPQ